MDFEWMVIDDGSQDETETLIQQYLHENVIPVIYEKQRNAGKHTALNRGIAKIKSRLKMQMESLFLLWIVMII